MLLALLLALTTPADSPQGTRGVSAIVGFAIAAAASPPHPTVVSDNGPLLRSLMADTANAQLTHMDDAWPVEQRDCAGLVRYVYRKAYARVAPDEVQRGLFLTRDHKYSAFADAETLLSGGSFKALGRSPALRESLLTGDIVAFRRIDGDASVYHLMLVVRPQDRAHDAAWVVYHPGSRDQGVRGGPLRDLERDAPREWQPVPENPAFLGYFRFEELMR